MLKINYNKNWYDIEFNGIKIIETRFTTNFIKSLITDNEQEVKMLIDNKNIRWKNVIYINEMTKYSDFLSLNKSNYLYKKIIDKIADNSLINDKLIELIIGNINKELQINDLLIKQYDLNKIIIACFELNDLGYIKDDDLFTLLNKIEYDEKKLIIFDNVSYATYEKCKKLLNNFNILIVCNDIRGIINNFNLLEICCIINKNVFDIINVEKLMSYIESKSSLLINETDINNYLEKKDDQKSAIINFYLKSL